MSNRLAAYGDEALFVMADGKKQFMRTIKQGQILQTHRGSIAFDELVGVEYGSIVRTHLGVAFYLFMPTTDDRVRHLKRQSQIVFPKDSGYLLLRLGVRPGSRVIESGTGSGGMCLVLATSVGDDGHVYSYDTRGDMQSLAKLHCSRAKVDHRVTFIHADAIEGFNQQGVDAVFLDLPAPWEVLDQARVALSGSGMLGAIVPTANQMIDLFGALRTHIGFGFVEAEEILLRQYKTVPARVRPDDRMIGHTGFLVTARALIRPQVESILMADQTEETG
ncbi:MAG: tRNA (adenine-N1)-methyltransferase [Chloroflexi bacterium]|nr:tRNA (adenine-N1)-methyltransferase [Chloroflexota bacterium]